MSVGKQVGRLSIKVLPDSTEFNVALKKMVERAEQKYKIHLDVEAVTRKAELTLARFRTVESKNKIEIDVRANTAAAKEQLAVLTRARSATIAVGANTAQARAQLIVAARDRYVDFNVRVKESSIAKANAAITRLSGFRVARQVFSDVTDSLKDIDLNVPKIARIATAIGSLSSVLLTSGAGIVTLTGDLLKMGNAGLVLPAMLAGAATGIITLALALKDSKEQLAELGPAMNELQGIISSSFWTQAKQPIIDFVESVLPQAREGFALTATALGNQAAAIAGAFQTTFGNGVLTGMFETLAQTMDIVTTGAKGFAESMTTLGVVGSAYLPRLATWVVQISDAFNAWVQRVAASGELDGFINDGIEQMKLFGSSIADIVRIFRGIDEAATAAGGGGLSTFAEKMAGAAAAVNSEGFQTALTTILVGANLAIDSMGTGFAAFGTTLAALAPQIGLVLSIAGATLGGLVEAIAKAMDQPAFKDGLVAFFTGIQAGVDALGPAMEPLFAFIGQLGTTLGALATVVGTVLAAIKITFAPALESVLQAVTPLIPMLGGVLIGAINTLGPALAGLVSFLAPAIPLFIGLAGAAKGVQFGLMIAGWARVTAVMLLSKLETIAIMALYAKDFVVNSAKVVAGLALQAGAWLKNMAIMALVQARAVAVLALHGVAMVGALAKTAVGLALQTGAWIANTAAQAAAKVVMVAGAVATGIATAAQWALNAAMSANPIALVVIAIAALVAGLIWFFTQTELGQEIWANFTTFLSEAWTNIQTVATTVFTAIAQFFSDTWNNIVSFVSTAIANVIAFVTANWGLLLSLIIGPLGLVIQWIVENWSGIVTFFSDTWNAIVAFTTTAINAVMAVIAAVVATISATWTAGWNAIGAFFSAVWTGIVAFVTAYIATVQTIIRTVVAAISATWTAVWNGISSFFSTIWTGIVAFVTAYLAAVKVVITTVVSAISSAWNTTWTAIGRFLSDLWNGIVTFVGTAIKGVQTVIATTVASVSSAWNTTWTTISNFISTIWNGIVSAVTGFIGSVLTTVSGVGSTIASTWNSIWSGIGDVVSTAAGRVGEFVGNIISGISGMIGSIGSTLAGIPGVVGAAFAGAGSWLMDAGKSIVQGLIDGIGNMIGAAKRAAQGVMDAIANFFPHSPAPEGPFSGRGWTLYSGQAMGDGLIDGMKSRVEQVRRSALAMMSAAADGTALVGVDAGLTGLNAMQTETGDRIVVEGNVGYDPKKIIEEIDIKKWQAQMTSGITRLAPA